MARRNASTASSVNKARMKAHTGNPENLVPFQKGEAAREAGRLGGIASGESRRKKISLRAELEALLAIDGGTVAKSIVLAMAREAKAGNVGAFKAIASVMGELQPETAAVAVTAPPIVIGMHDPSWIEQERARQREADRANTQI